MCLSKGGWFYEGCSHQIRSIITLSRSTFLQHFQHHRLVNFSSPIMKASDAEAMEQVVGQGCFCLSRRLSMHQCCKVIKLIGVQSCLSRGKSNCHRHFQNPLHFGGFSKERITSEWARVFFFFCFLFTLSVSASLHQSITGSLRAQKPSWLLLHKL